MQLYNLYRNTNMADDDKGTLVRADIDHNCGVSYFTRLMERIESETACAGMEFNWGGEQWFLQKSEYRFT